MHKIHVLKKNISQYNHTKVLKKNGRKTKKSLKKLS